MDFCHHGACRLWRKNNVRQMIPQIRVTFAYIPSVLKDVDVVFQGNIMSGEGRVE